MKGAFGRGTYRRQPRRHARSRELESASGKTGKAQRCRVLNLALRQKLPLATSDAALKKAALVESDLILSALFQASFS
jgi:hypothetical protein